MRSENYFLGLLGKLVVNVNVFVRGRGIQQHPWAALPSQKVSLRSAATTLAHKLHVCVPALVGGEGKMKDHPVGIQGLNLKCALVTSHHSLLVDIFSHDQNNLTRKPGDVIFCSAARSVSKTWGWGL